MPPGHGASPSVRGRDRWWRHPVGVAALLLVGVASVGLSVVAGDPGGSTDDDQVVLFGNGRGAIARPTPGGAGMACVPAGCQAWRVDAPGGQGVVASDELVLHVGQQRLTAYEVRSGQVRWQRPAPAYASQSPRLHALSAHGLAFLRDGGGLVDGPSPDPAPVPARVSVHDPVDGSRRFDLALGGGIVQQAVWIADRLLVVAADFDQPRTRVFGVTPTGEIAWRRDGVLVPRRLPGTSAVLASGDGRVARVDVADGRVVWRVPGALVARSDLGGPLLVHDVAAGVLRVVDPATGTTRRTLGMSGATGAVAFGPWVLVGGRDTARVIDPATGRQLFTRPDPVAPAPDATIDADADPRGLLRVSTAVQVGARVAVAWADATRVDGIQLAVHDLDGGRQGTVTVPVPAVMGGGIELHAVAGRADLVLVHLTTGDGPTGSIAAVDLQAREVVGVTDSRLVESDEELLVLRQGDGLTVLGPTGRVRVRNARQVASLDPLVVHGVNGIMRLDRRLVTGGDGAPSGTAVPFGHG